MELNLRNTQFSKGTKIAIEMVHLPRRGFMIHGVFTERNPKNTTMNMLVV